MRNSLLLSSLIILSLTACGSSDKKDLTQMSERKEVEVLYDQATTALKEGRYIEASHLFQEVERQHPYSQLAVKSQLNTAYAAYKDLRYDEAIIALDRFVELHPGNEDVPYALYLKALCYYEQISDVRRDQEMTTLALNAFDALIKRFPENDYARDGELKRDLTMDHLAGKEMEVGRYYLTRGQINAGINRFLVVVRQFDTTTHVPEALHRLIESYLILGLEAQALRIAAVLGHNYPGSEWYEASYKLLNPAQRQRLIDSRGFFDKTIEAILKPE
ncbi:MAG: outer membrane protein assembly factor BamD [Bdellovibrionales bacterium]